MRQSMISSRRMICLPVLLALACWSKPITAYGVEQGFVPLSGHEFPSMFALQDQWNKFQQESSPKVEVIQALLEKDADGGHVVPVSESTHRSVWVIVNRWLKEHPETLIALRAAQNVAAPAKLLMAKRTGEPDKLLRLCRTYPWADAVHHFQIDTAEQVLRTGHAQLALRWFEDVLERSENAELRSRAQAGLWLSVAHSTDSADSIRKMLQGIDPSLRYPWFGRQLSAKEIEARLLTGIKPAQPFPHLNDLSLRTLQLPDDPPWIGWKSGLNPTSHELVFRHKVYPVTSDRGIVVAAPCLVAWYEGDALDRPAWSKIATLDISHGSSLLPRAPFDPVIADGRVYVRGASDLAPADKKRTRNAKEARLHIGHLDQIVAFDQHSGERIWSTADDPAWSRLFAVNAPLYCDGRLYMLAMHKWGGPVLIGGNAPVFLVIADSKTGRLLRKRELVSYKSKLQGTTNITPRPPRIPRKLDLSAGAVDRGKFFAHIDQSKYGNRQTIHDGAVYSLTSMGAAARCDVRDGLIEWVVTYPQIVMNSVGVRVPYGWTHQWDAPYIIRRRQAIAPLVGDKVVVFSPLDSVAVFAVDRETGEKLWQKIEIDDAITTESVKETGKGSVDQHVQDGSLEALGLIGDSVLVVFDRKIAVLEVSTGKVRWTCELDGVVERPLKIVDRTIYLATGIDLFQIDGTTGKVLAKRALTTLRTDNGFVFDNKGMIVVLPGKRGITSYDLLEELQ
jgi:outer membrane protein assembly factor BamB